MVVPPGLLEGEGKYHLLLKPLYGLMQGRRDQWHTLDSAYRNCGYQTLHANSCIRSRKIGGAHTIINIFNNDIFRVFTMLRGAQKAKQEFAAIYNVKDLGTPLFILGMAIEQDTMTGAILLSQKACLN